VLQKIKIISLLVCPFLRESEFFSRHINERGSLRDSYRQMEKEEIQFKDYFWEGISYENHGEASAIGA
jgi:hypothetical protein